MPATPRFSLSQTDEVIIICIKVPHVRVGNAETHMDGRDFSFYCKPYLLRYFASAALDHTSRPQSSLLATSLEQYFIMILIFGLRRG